MEYLIYKLLNTLYKLKKKGSHFLHARKDA
jgi:hypothetical protein